MIKCSLEEAEGIFNAYHNDMYPAISKMRDETLAVAKKQGKVHLGLGCYIHTNNPELHIRSLFNGLSQFWSMLSLLTINKLHHLIDEQGYQNDIKVISSIYDSIYLTVKADPTIIKWLNDTIVPIMTKDFMVDQIVHNNAEGEIGLNWSNVLAIKNNATLDDVTEVLNKVLATS